MGKVVKVAAVGGVFLVSFVLFQVFTGRPPTAREIQAEVDRNVAQLKPTLPQQVHPLVTWFDVESGPQTIIYKYQIKAPRSAVLSKRAELETQLKQSSVIWAAKLMMPRGVKLNCEFYDEHREYLFDMDLD